MKKGTCIHFTGIQKDCCKVGINYVDLVAGERFGMALRLPCWTSTMAHAKDVEKVSCAQYFDPTDVQIAHDTAETDALMARIGKIMPVVDVWRKMEPIGKQEVIDCPACGGRLHLSQAGCNGHVQGHCETTGCARWME